MEASRVGLATEAELGGIVTVTDMSRMSFGQDSGKASVISVLGANRPDLLALLLLAGKKTFACAYTCA